MAADFDRRGFHPEPLYTKLTDNYNEFLRYAIKTSDSFGLISSRKRPYSRIPPDCIHDDFLEPLFPYLIDFEPNVWGWQGNRLPHMVLFRYSACTGARNILRELPNLMEYAPESQPEDLHFYRGKTIWLLTITHEGMVCFKEASTVEDYDFFKQL